MYSVQSHLYKEFVWGEAGELDTYQDDRDARVPLPLRPAGVRARLSRSPDPAPAPLLLPFPLPAPPFAILAGRRQPLSGREDVGVARGQRGEGGLQAATPDEGEKGLLLSGVLLPQCS